MRVKRYVVDSMPDALQKIRTDLGKDAVIMNTKEIRSGGFLGFFSKKRIEVIAAIEQENTVKTAKEPPVSRPKAKSAAVPAKSATAKKEQPAQPEPVKPVPAVPAATVPKAYKAAVAVSSPHDQPAEAVKEVSQLSTAFLSEMKAFREEAAETSDQAGEPVSREPEVPHSSREDVLLSEIQQLKAMMAQMSAVGVQPPPSRAEPFAGMERHLRNQGIDPKWIEELLNQADSAAAGAQTTWTPDELRQSVASQLKDWFNRDGSPSPVSRTAKMIHFVGPTGVGKTTTIAKLAAEQVLKHHKKAGFITSDTYRISAVEQLRTYANILGVPLEVVFSPQDLPRAFEALQDVDVIFMDTAGRNFRKELAVSELNALLQSCGETETYLVLSLTTKYEDIRVITENFIKFGVDKVLFTKMDETATYGTLVNLKRDFQLPFSYLTDGQNVPDDITLADEDKIVELLLEGYSHG
ncbi:flagellar biosynthesis protein FlhF [Paenibacillus larvae]